MSNRSTEGAGSQNSKKNQEIPSWEVVKPTDYEYFELHSKLIDTLTLTVSAKVDQIKKYALLQLQGLSAENDMALVGVPSPSQSLTDTTAASPAFRKSQTVTSVVIGDIAVSFECPEQFTANNVDTDLAASCYRNFLERDGVVNTMKPLQFSFRERLQNWNIQCRMRPHGRLDMFYRYPRGRKSFGSVNEVIDFMLYEICPDTHKQDMPQDQANNEGEAAAEKPKKRRRSSIYRGGRRRRKHRKTKGKADQKAEEKSATEEADDQGAQKEQNTNPSSPPEPQEQASPDTDLLKISDDLNAYESLFDKYFDDF